MIQAQKRTTVWSLVPRPTVVARAGLVPFLEQSTALTLRGGNEHAPFPCSAHRSVRGRSAARRGVDEAACGGSKTHGVEVSADPRVINRSSSSGLPVRPFGHEAGLEAASPLGLGSGSKQRPGTLNVDPCLVLAAGGPRLGEVCHSEANVGVRRSEAWLPDPGRGNSRTRGRGRPVRHQSLGGNFSHRAPGRKC